MKISEFRALLRSHGIEARDVARNPAPRLVFSGEPWGADEVDGQVLIEVRVLAKNERGQRFVDRAMNQAAGEWRLVPLDEDDE